MRTSKFRDVLWAIAYKSGQDPLQGDFQTNQAVPIGRSIEQWVRRLYPSQDWPEWAVTHKFVPVNHVVTWDATAIDLVIPPSVVGTVVQIGRVLAVYLIDPRTTDAPVETDFELQDNGVHVGYEHGTHVWIKFLVPAPKFTAEVWRANNIFAKDEVTYSDVTGECYRSKVNGNINHDPASSFSPPPTPPVDDPPPVPPPAVEIVQQLVKSSPGNPGLPMIVDIYLDSGDGTIPVPDPPPAGFEFVIGAEWNAGADSATNLYDTVGGVTLGTIATTLAATMTGNPDWTGFTITGDSGNKKIRLEADLEFTILFWNYIELADNTFMRLNRIQTQTFTPTVGGANETQQQIQVTLTDDQVTDSAEYSLIFRGSDGIEHTVTYTANLFDGVQQILTGLASQLQASADTFFEGIMATIDLTNETVTFGSPLTVSVETQILLPGSPWWELVPFPLTLADQVIRGATGDLMKEWGQTQEGMMEEQAVGKEAGIAVDRFTNPASRPLTEQLRASRYAQ